LPVDIGVIVGFDVLMIIVGTWAFGKMK